MMIIRQHQQMDSAASRTPIPLPHQVVEQGDDIYARDTNDYIQYKVHISKILNEHQTCQKLARHH